MRAYPSDLRGRALADGDAGMATDEVAAQYRVSASRVRRLKRRRRETGSTAPEARRHGPKPGRAGHAERIAAAVRERPDATPEGHRAGLGPGLSTSPLWRAIQAPGPAVGKRPRGPPSGTAPMAPGPASVGGPACPTRAPTARPSSTRPGRART